MMYDAERRERDAAGMSLLWLLREEITSVNVSGNNPLWLDDPDAVWIVYTGKVDVFSAQCQEGRDIGVRQWLLRAEMGQALFGMGTQADSPGLTLMASGAPDTVLVQIDRARFQELAHHEKRAAYIVHALDEWIVGLTGAFADTLTPREYQSLVPSQTLELPPETVVFPEQGYLWVRHQEGRSRFVGRDLSPQDGTAYLPISKHTWLETQTSSELEAMTTEQFVTVDRTWQGLDRFHRLVLAHLYAKARRLQAQERQRLQSKAEVDWAIVDRALTRLFAPFQLARSTAPSIDADGDLDPLLVASMQVGQALGIAIRPPPPVRGERTPDDPLDRIARASQIRTRRVVLRGTWWREDVGPLLAFAGEHEFDHPVALLPSSATRYELYDPVQQQRTPVTRKVAETLYPFAYTFYRAFPDRVLTAWDVWRFGLSGGKNDMVRLVVMGSLVSLLGLLMPLASGWLFDELIPSAANTQIVQVFAALIASAFAAAVFRLVGGIATLRLQTRLSNSVQSAVWDRLLGLAVPFFRNYSAGDLSARAMGIDRMRRKLSGPTISALLGGVFSLPNIVLMIYYSPRLALAGIGLVCFLTAVTTLVGRRQIYHQRKLAEIQGEIAGTILQFITGISKLRVAGAEGRAFAFWAKRFAQQKKIDVRTQTLANGLLTFRAVYPLLSTMIMFALSVVVSDQRALLSPGDFVAFYAAFGQLLTAGLLAGSAVLSVADVVPIYERVKPILQALPEKDEFKVSPQALSGRIEIQHVRFRYQRDGPDILNDICLEIAPGEFVALVGPSGSGKSTLIRLLLGFEQPQSGTILYDGQDLRELDILAVRRQIGVVLQTGKLMRGTILENIIGSLLLTVEDAWTAARLVGLDEDIEAMPMGMYTILSTGGGTLSGGQRQRILIARAIVHRPRILIFDEATSALDNLTQSMISNSLSHIQATRIVVAHRLSTIRESDRIFVIDKGRILQSGTFEALSKQDGLFVDLAERQIF